jgi:polar amino acid transport system substrate-binding protein
MSKIPISVEPVPENLNPPTGRIEGWNTGQQRFLHRNRGNLFSQALITLFAVSIICCSVTGYAQEIQRIKVATEEWESNTNADGTGSFFEMIQAVYAMDGIAMEFQIVPYERSVEMTRTNEVDAWVAAYDEEEDFALFPDWHFDADIVTAVFKKERFPEFSGVESLEGNVVSWIRGYAYDEYIETDMEIYRLDKRTSAMEMLVRDRIDIYLDADAEIQGMISDREFNRKINFWKESYEFKEILRLNLYLAFADTERGKRLIEIWDTNFPILLESGEIQRIYDKYEVSPLPFD